MSPPTVSANGKFPSMPMSHGEKPVDVDDRQFVGSNFYACLWVPNFARNWYRGFAVVFESAKTLWWIFCSLALSSTTQITEIAKVSLPQQGVRLGQSPEEKALSDRKITEDACFIFEGLDESYGIKSQKYERPSLRYANLEDLAQKAVSFQETVERRERTIECFVRSTSLLCSRLSAMQAENQTLKDTLAKERRARQDLLKQVWGYLAMQQCTSQHIPGHITKPAVGNSQREDLCDDDKMRFSPSGCRTEAWGRTRLPRTRSKPAYSKSASAGKKKRQRQTVHKRTVSWRRSRKSGETLPKQLKVGKSKSQDNLAKKEEKDRR